MTTATPRTVEAQHRARLSRRLIRAAGGLEAAAEITGKSKTQLGRYQDANDDASITLEVIEELEGVTRETVGHPIVTRYLAQQAGFALVKLPSLPSGRSAILDLLARHSKEGGDIASAICAALLDDNEVTPDEAPAIRKEIWQLIEVCVAMDAELAAIEEVG